MKIKEEHRKKVEERGYKYISTYEKGDYTIDKGILLKRTSQYVRIKCLYCDTEYDIQLVGLINRGHNCRHCCNKYENSFAYHIQVELGEPLNKYWDWERNAVNPYLISKNRNGKSRKGENLKVWLKCDKTNYHGSYEISCQEFIRGNACPYCSKHKVHPKDSFAQYHIDNTDPNFLEKYWSDKNTLNPWQISPQSHKKVWIKCQNKDYHDDYLMSCGKFTHNRRCPLCAIHHWKVHPKDSFGTLYPEKAKYWSAKNESSPFEVASFSNKKYWFICEKCGEEFERRMGSVNRVDTGIKCIKCNASKGEVKIVKILNSFNFTNNIDYVSQKEFEGLVGLRGGNLSYDFYLPKYNLLIEYQGEQHCEYKKGFVKNKKSFIKQLEHDRRKFNYAINNNIDILYIYYWQYDEIEDILNYELQL